MRARSSCTPNHRHWTEIPEDGSICDQWSVRLALMGLWTSAGARHPIATVGPPGRACPQAPQRLAPREPPHAPTQVEKNPIEDALRRHAWGRGVFFKSLAEQ